MVDDISSLDFGDKLINSMADVRLPKSDSFCFIKPVLLPTDGDSNSNQQNEEEAGTSAVESTSLLAEHKKRHGLFYLPSNDKKDVSSSFPPANDPNQRDNDVEDLVKLTEESLVLKRKPSLIRPRPVVVKLDEGDRHPITVKY
ncbi:hypothetical protein E3N88_04529 [Mikania micrantha]|uniref:Uncharacterized protein n=1 Tax=Mikania micrantha TaxID=192012 RepID=A0A5N6PWS4_9ASTR|nr:hypothetical protein E3N88_04529 [Mikania micrantha]